MGRECPDCGSTNIDERKKEGRLFSSDKWYYICADCGYTFGEH